MTRLNAITAALALAGAVHADVMLAGSWDADAIVMFDLDTGEYLGVFASGVSNPSGILVLEDGRMLVGSGNSVLQFDARTGDPLGKLIDVNAAIGDNFLAGNMFMRGGMLYVHGWYNADVVRVDPDTGALIDLLIDEGGGHGNASTTMAYGPNDRLYMTEWRRHTVNVFDAGTGAYVGSIGSANRAAGIDFDESGVGYVGEYHTNTSFNDGVFAWGGGSGYHRVVGEVMFHGPQAIEVHGGRIYVGDQTSINVYDASTGDRIATLQPNDGADNFFAFAVIPEAPCYADCDRTTTLDIFDFLCFQDAFIAMEPYADCTGEGAYDVFDFLCFQDAFVSGCP